MGDQKIQRLFSDLIGHNSTVPVILSLAGKAVCAVQIAGMRHMQAQSLDHPGGFLFQFPRHRFKHIRRKKCSLTYIPISEKTLRRKNGDLMILYHLLPEIAVEAWNRIHPESKNLSPAHADGQNQG